MRIIKQSLLALACTLPMLAQAENPMKLHGEAYKGPKNLLVELGYFEDGKEALVAISGVNSKLDGKVLKTRVQPGGTGMDFTAQIEGKPFVILTTRKSYGQETVTAFLPESGSESIPLQFDTAMSADENPSKLLSLYESQQVK